MKLVATSSAGKRALQSRHRPVSEEVSDWQVGHCIRAWISGGRSLELLKILLRLPESIPDRIFHLESVPSSHGFQEKSNRITEAMRLVMIHNELTTH